MPSPSALLLDLPNAMDLPRFSPTVPSSESGSPTKEHAPLDPTRPQFGMTFHSLTEAVHFTQEYERRRGYHWRKGESIKTHDGVSPLHLALGCN